MEGSCRVGLRVDDVPAAMRFYGGLASGCLVAWHRSANPRAHLHPQHSPPKQARCLELRPIPLLHGFADFMLLLVAPLLAESFPAIADVGMVPSRLQAKF